MKKKSIYEETLDIIENIDRNLPYTWVMGRDSLMKIKQTLKQAQKQEKLLELYKEALETNFEGITLIKLVNITLRTQIKELENEGGRK